MIIFPNCKYMTILAMGGLCSSQILIRSVFKNDALNNMIPAVLMSYQGEPLTLRFKFNFQFQDVDQVDFIDILKKGNNAYIGGKA